jgi:hypothetical protein
MMIWSWRNSCSALTRPRLPRRRSTPTTTLPRLPLLRLVPLQWQPVSRARSQSWGCYRKNDRGNSGSGGRNSSGQSSKGQGRKPNPASPSWPSFYNPWTGTISMYTGLALGVGVEATPPFAEACSYRCAWTDHGRPTVHTTHGADPDSIANVCCLVVAGRFSSLDALARLVGPAFTSKLLQHDNALDAALTYRVAR